MMEKVSQRGLGGFPHERLALALAVARNERHPEGVKRQAFRYQLGGIWRHFV